MVQRGDCGGFSFLFFNTNIFILFQKSSQKNSRKRSV
ncbi:hypothetical protein QTP86_021359 [Hemibagrus guttatus]|nr:hypothetical protein QTP86_021359 [Hemibagrus guttatus]